MLSGQEEQAFAQIAEQIAADDPQFAVSMGRLQSRRPGGGHHVVVVVAAATAVLCLLLSLVLPAFVAAALAFHLWILALLRCGVDLQDMHGGQRSSVRRA